MRASDVVVGCGHTGTGLRYWSDHAVLAQALEDLPCVMHGGTTVKRLNTQIELSTQAGPLLQPNQPQDTSHSTDQTPSMISQLVKQCMFVYLPKTLNAEEAQDFEWHLDGHRQRLSLRLECASYI